MIRTILIARQAAGPPAPFLHIIERIAQLYRSRVMDAVWTDRTQPADDPADELPSENNSLARQRAVLSGPFVPALCDKGHEADVIVVWQTCLVESGRTVQSDDLADLLRHAPRPIWVGRDPIRFPEHLVVAYDGSTHAGRALHLAANMAETLGARLTVLNVNESRDEAAQELILRRAANYCAAYDISVERVGLFGAAAESVRTYAQAHQCDLLVMGAAGIGYLRGLLFGSVAGQLVATAPCSVLVAK